MLAYIALLRGINVGGKNVLSMKALTKLLEEHGCTKVKTYIQSGNVVFQRPSSEAQALGKMIVEAIFETHGFLPKILVLTPLELEEAIRANPFPQAGVSPKSLHLYFLSEIPQNPDFKELNRIKTETESFQLVGKVFYLFAPDGIGRSKLASKLETCLHVEATARNWNTVTKLHELL